MAKDRLNTREVALLSCKKVFIEKHEAHVVHPSLKDLGANLRTVVLIYLHSLFLCYARTCSADDYRDTNDDCPALVRQRGVRADT